MRKTVCLLAVLFLTIVNLVEAGGSAQHWWEYCANRYFNGMCANVEACCHQQYTDCRNSCYEENVTDEAARQPCLNNCNSRYSAECVWPAIFCFDDPNWD